MMGWSPQCYIPSFVKIDLPVPEKKILEGFYHMMGWSPQCYIPSFVKIDLPVPEKKILEGFLPYMGVAAILVM